MKPGFVPEEGTPKNVRRVFGEDVNVSSITVDITGVGTGYTVTVTAFLEDGEVIFAATAYRANASLEEATEELVVEALDKLNTFFEENENV